MPETGNSISEIAASFMEEKYKEKTWREKGIFPFIHRFAKRKTAVIGLTILLILALLAICAPLLTKYDYRETDYANMYASPSAEHIFGTDALGRDLFTRMLYGARYSLSISILSEGLTLILGMILGAIAGYADNKLSTVIMRFCDIIQSMPNILMCVCVSVVLGGGVIPTIIALSIAGIPSQTRMLRSTMMTVRDQEFVEASQAIGCKKIVTVFKHVVPNCLAPCIINSTSAIGNRIITSASLSYLGLGIQEPLPEWGALIAYGKQFFQYYPHLAIVPAIAIAICVLSYNLIGDGIRDALDPKLKS